jgi:hypothetical protein
MRRWAQSGWDCGGSGFAVLLAVELVEGWTAHTSKAARAELLRPVTENVRTAMDDSGSQCALDGERDTTRKPSNTVGRIRIGLRVGL